jgi:hypothetical protein
VSTILIFAFTASPRHGLKIRTDSRSQAIFLTEKLLLKSLAGREKRRQFLENNLSVLACGDSPSFVSNGAVDLANHRGDISSISEKEPFIEQYLGKEFVAESFKQFFVIVIISTLFVESLSY